MYQWLQPSVTHVPFGHGHLPDAHAPTLLAVALPQGDHITVALPPTRHADLSRSSQTLSSSPCAQEEREAAVAVVEHMIRDYRVLFSQRKRGRPLFSPDDDAVGAVPAVERAERMPSVAVQPRHPLPLTNVSSL